MKTLTPRRLQVLEVDRSHKMSQTLKMSKNKKMSVSEDSGFAEAAAQPIAPAAPAETWRLKVGSDGRVLLPAAMRAQLELGSDGLLTGKVVDGELKLISPSVAIRRMQALFAKVKRPGVSIVDEFIAERRAEALREDQK